MNRKPHIIAAAREVDGIGLLASLRDQWKEIQTQDTRCTELVIDPLEAGWDTPIANNHFRSGNAPLEALARATELIQENHADAVLISGQDLLRSRYQNDKALRREQMAIYDDYSIPEAYTLLAKEFIQLHGISQKYFKALAEQLFENYLRTAKRQDNFFPPRPEAFQFVTELFRAVDCANPVVDFSGAIIVASEQQGDGHGIKVLSANCQTSPYDGPEFASDFATYDELRLACAKAYVESQINFPEEFLGGRALLEAYTCFPVVPLGFLLASRIAIDFADIEEVLRDHEITVTGGMNLVRAPWNNPALNALIVMCEKLTSGSIKLGAVHGNGGLGYKQGIAILQS